MSGFSAGAILTASSKVVTPVKTGVQCFCNMLKFLDSGVHRNDGCWAFSTFDESIRFDSGTHKEHENLLTWRPPELLQYTIVSIMP